MVRPPFGQFWRLSSEKNSILISHLRAVSEKRSENQHFFPGLTIPGTLRTSPGNRNNLADDIGVLVNSVFFIATKIPCVLIDNEGAIFDPTARGEVSAIALKDDIDRLLPKILRHQVNRRLPAAVDHHNQSLFEIGVKRIVVSANPEEIILRDVCGTAEISKGMAQEERDFLALFDQSLQKPG